MVHGLRSRRVVTPQGELDATVVMEDGVIAAIHSNQELPAAVAALPTEDLGSLALLPGFVDTHTHINEPGRTEWEGFRTATRAAAAGGFTTLVDMPLNCLPETTTVAALEVKREAAFHGGPADARGQGSSQALVDLAFWGGCVDGNQAYLEPLAAAGVAGFKSFLIYPGCDGFTAIDRENLQAALPHISRTGLPLLVHAELEPAITAAQAEIARQRLDWHHYSTYLASRPDQAELDAIAMLIDLCRQALRRGEPFRLHIVHLSTAQALPMLAAAKREGLPLTVETCPHFLHAAAEEIPDGATHFKSAPAIRTRSNRELLWKALLDGTLDLIATDHSPCPPELKRMDPAAHGPDAGRFDMAWGGIASLSTALPVVWTEASQRGASLSQMVQWMSAGPAALAGLSRVAGGIVPGRHASLLAFDPEGSLTITPERLHYRHPISPYMGETLKGVVRATWVRGERVFTREPQGGGYRDVFAVTPPGREHTLC